jgi:hypothetical protein
MTLRRALGALSLLLIVLAAADTARGFATLGSKWANGTVTMHLQLTSSGALSDGSANFDAAVTDAMATWNPHIDFVKFSAIPASARPKGDGDLINHVFFDSQFYGESFGTDTLAITTRWTDAATGQTRLEGDVVFNTAFQWDSYRGNVRSSGGREVWDIRRVALHELGHVLGLDHPDDHGQRVDALMNSLLGNLDALTADDIAGVKSLYGSGGVTSNVTFPPRNEPNDFFQQLIALYRDRLGAPSVTTFVDPEGAVVWLSEYARYRVGLCDHGTSQSRVFAIIDTGVSTGVCALTPAGGIPFPPRNEGLVFMNALNAKYRDDLRRPATTSFVDNEGAVVWVLEYFRYRLNRCGHGDATTRVFQQILGQGIQPTC